MSPDKNNKQPGKPTAGNNEDDTLTPEELAAALALKKQKRAAQARLNGAHSHGPVTPEGKAISSKNSLVHGHAAKINVLIDADDEEAFDTHLAGYHLSFRPTDYFESELVDELAAASWKRSRLAATLTTLIDFQLSIQEQNVNEYFPLEADNPNLHLALAWQSLARKPLPRELPISPLDPIDPTLPPDQLDISSIELVRRYMMLHDRQFRAALNNLRQYRKDFKTSQEEAQAPTAATTPAQQPEPKTTQNPSKPNEPTKVTSITRPKPLTTTDPPQEAGPNAPEVAA